MKYHLNYCEFYITNVCNLNCTNCNRFNNYNFKGNYSWNLYKDEYKKWAKILDINSISILGGEPSLNPEFLDYVQGIRYLWPNSKISITTNGTQLHRWKNLYEVLLKNKIYIDMSVHNHDQWNEKVSYSKKLLSDPIVEDDFIDNPEIGVFSLFEDLVNQKNREWQIWYNKVKADSWPQCNTPYTFDLLPDVVKKECIDDFNLDIESYKVNKKLKRGTRLTDRNGVVIGLSKSDQFYSAAVQYNNKKLSLHNSNPKKAIAGCRMKKCHHFIDGKLYKCGVSGILPNFIKQFPVSIDQADRDLINSYRPASPDDEKDFLNVFFENLNSGDAIPQCKFCPENYNREKIVATNKKIKL